MDRSEVKAPIIAPSAYPACRSADIKTTGKSVNVESYWRCAACGQAWNVGRREPTPQHVLRMFSR